MNCQIATGNNELNNLTIFGHLFNALAQGWNSPIHESVCSGKTSMSLVNQFTNNASPSSQFTMCRRTCVHIARKQQFKAML